MVGYVYKLVSLSSSLHHLMFGQNLRHFIKAQKKYVAIAVIVTVIVAILINRRAFQYADLFQSVIQSVQDHNQQAFFTALIGLIILELVLFVVRLCTDTLKIKYR
jgi:ABC-type tungstate transport system substrate-binding protein